MVVTVVSGLLMYRFDREFVSTLLDSSTTFLESSWATITRKEPRKTTEDKSKKKPTKRKPSYGSSIKPTQSYLGTGPFLTGTPGVRAPQIISRTKPLTPYGIKGVTFPVKVIVQTIILKNGEVGTADVVNSVHPAIDQVAVKTVNLWKFKPGTKYGQKADIIMDIVVEFTE